MLPIAATAFVLGGCGGGGSVSLAKLAANQDAYLGKRVTTTGTVEVQTNTNHSRYYVLADRAQDLVILTPARIAHRYVGTHVTVTGRFAFDARAGRLIRIERIAASD